MKELGIHSIVVKKFRYHREKVTSDKKENLLNRDFTTTAIHQKWCTDITYIYTKKDGWTYLDSVIDLHSKKILGYAYDRSMTAELAIKAIKNVCLNVKDTEEILWYSDLGIQYTSHAFEIYLKERGILQSFSRKEIPYVIIHKSGVL